MNLQAILDQYQIPYRITGQHEHAREGWVQVDCPNCSKGSGRFRLGINLGGWANCWSCGGRSLINVLMELTGESYPEIRALTDTLDKAPRKRSEGLQRVGCMIPPPSLQELKRPHRSYLRGRGFNPDHLVQLWGIQGIAIHPSLSWSIWIPIYHEGQIVSWTTRAIGDKGKRYMNARPEQEAIPAKQLCYGMDYVRHSTIVCEGPTDVWRIGPGAVATMGLSYSQDQLIALSKIPSRAICFDREPAAQKRARKLAKALYGFEGETHVVELELGDDVADSNEEEVELIRETFLNRS